jgi:hypothetical protein
MDRRHFLHTLSGGAVSAFAVSLTGCRGKQHAHILKEDDENMVGSHAAGAAVFEPLVAEAVQKLLGQEAGGIQQAGFEAGAGTPKRVCFIGIENASAEELGDFREQIYEIIDQNVVASQVFEPISRRFVEAGLRETRLHPEDFFIKSKRDLFAQVMEQQGQSFDYLLFAKITSGTTISNSDDKQRDYLLTLEMVNLETGVPIKQSAKIRKGYHKSVLGRIKNY